MTQRAGIVLILGAALLAAAYFVRRPARERPARLAARAAQHVATDRAQPPAPAGPARRAAEPADHTLADPAAPARTSSAFASDAERAQHLTAQAAYEQDMSANYQRVARELEAALASLRSGAERAAPAHATAVVQKKLAQAEQKAEAHRALAAIYRGQLPPSRAPSP